jgi:hypothetical protein
MQNRRLAHPFVSPGFGDARARRRALESHPPSTASTRGPRRRPRLARSPHDSGHQDRHARIWAKALASYAEDPEQVRRALLRQTAGSPGVEPLAIAIVRSSVGAGGAVVRAEPAGSRGSARSGPAGPETQATVRAAGSDPLNWRNVPNGAGILLQGEALQL